MKSPVSVEDLLEAGLLKSGEVLTGASKKTDYRATVEPDGRITLVGGATFRSLSVAANAVTHRHTNGWEFWRVDRSGEQRTLAEIRANLVA